MFVHSLTPLFSSPLLSSSGNIKELPFEEDSESMTTSDNKSNNTASSQKTSSESQSKKRKVLTLSSASQKRLGATVHFSSFLTLLLRLLCHILSHTTHTDHDTEVVEHAMSLITDAVAARPELLQTLREFKEGSYQTGDEVVLALLCCRHTPLRACVVQYLRTLATKRRDPPLSASSSSSSASSPLLPSMEWLLSLLLNNLPHHRTDLNNDTTIQYREFFDLLESLLTIVFQYTRDTSTQNSYSSSQKR
jgi:hypothetical protein